MSSDVQRPAESAEDVADESEPQVHFEPLVQLEEVEVRTHEEDEDILYSQRARLFRFDPPTSEWKERGTGDVRLLKHRETGLTRALMRREKTLKVCLNHLEDFSEGDHVEIFAIRFRSSEIASAFHDQFEKAKKDMETALETRGAEEKTSDEDSGDVDKKEGETPDDAGTPLEEGASAAADGGALGVADGPSDEKDRVAVESPSDEK